MKLVMLNKGERFSFDPAPEKISWRKFLLDILFCSFRLYGGAEKELKAIIRRLVLERKYMNDEEIQVLLQLSSYLPGSSNKHIMRAIAYKVGGARLGRLTMVVRTLPALLFILMFVFIIFFLTRLFYY